MNVKIDRVLSKVSFDHDCWRWNGRVDECGYGRTCFGGATNAMAHRVLYEHMVGPIPDGMQIDHMCRNRGCVNPMHLDVVTHAENCRRGTHGDYLARRDRCANGHEFTEQNTRICRRGARRCRACARAATAKHRALRRPATAGRSA